MKFDMKDESVILKLADGGELSFFMRNGECIEACLNGWEFWYPNKDKTEKSFRFAAEIVDSRYEIYTLADLICHAETFAQEWDRQDRIDEINQRRHEASYSTMWGR